MRAAAFFFLTLTAASAAALLPHAGAVAAEEGTGAGATSSRTVPEWFNGQTTEYYTMPQFVVPVIEGNAVTRQISLLVTLETFGSVNREKVMSKRERLQDAFLRDMYGVLAVHRPDGGKYGDAVRTRLRRVGDKIVGAGVIRNIFVKTTYDRPLTPSRH
jgi:hypothetical protein